MVFVIFSVCIVGALYANRPSIASISIEQVYDCNPITLDVGERIQLATSVKMSNGELASAAVMEDLQLEWGTNKNDVISVGEEGLIIALNPGIATVFVRSENGKLYSRPTSIQVDKPC